MNTDEILTLLKVGEENEQILHVGNALVIKNLQAHPQFDHICDTLIAEGDYWDFHALDAFDNTLEIKGFVDWAPANPAIRQLGEIIRGLDHYGLEITGVVDLMVPPALVRLSAHDRIIDVHEGSVMVTASPLASLQLSPSGNTVTPPRYAVHLKAVSNPDYEDDPRDPRGHLSIPANMAPVASLREASLVVRTFIDSHDLGGGNWAGGEVYTLDERFGTPKDLIAKVSYNGRVWEPGAYPTPEIDVTEFDRRAGKKHGRSKSAEWER
jgi:hypothetical protein